MLEYKNIDISYHKDLVLKDINVKFEKGCITSVIGPNGCGKTTLLQSLIGSSKVIAGNILLDGDNYFHKSPKERAKSVAFLPQVRTVIPSLSVKTLVGHGRFPHMGFGRKESKVDNDIIEKAMEYAKVKEYADKNVDTLSGGIRQRVFLAMILAQDADYMVFDEPTTYLDLKGQRDFLQLVKGLKEKGKTIIMVLHDINQALDISDNIVIMKDRNIIKSGTKEECIRDNILESVFDVKCEKFENENNTYYYFH